MNREARENAAKEIIGGISMYADSRDEVIAAIVSFAAAEYQRGIEDAAKERIVSKEQEAREANTIDDVVQQIMAIDGPCSCESHLCLHWRTEAGIILAGFLSDRDFDVAEYRRGIENAAKYAEYRAGLNTAADHVPKHARAKADIRRDEDTLLAHRIRALVDPPA